MELLNNDLFYSRLPVNEIPLSELFTEEHLFYKIPGNWHVVITDIKNSTGAVTNGLHETVNLVATGSIVAVLNIAYKNNITVPFFFGGDGASFIIPASILDNVMKALLLHSENTKSTFKLDLRVGHVSVKEIYDQQHTLHISKLRTSKQFAIPVLLGDGLAYAEKKIKGPDYIFSMLGLPDIDLDLSGMQCRWDKIKPPQNFFEVVSLLVVLREDVIAHNDVIQGNDFILSEAKDLRRNPVQQQANAFKKVIEKIDSIYGNPETRKPITVAKLRLKATLAKIGLEMNVRMGGFRPLYLMSNWLKTLLGHLYFKTKKGKVYLLDLVDMSDTLVIDGKINTVISGTAQQRQLLIEALDKIESEGEIFYGLFVSSESVMSCYVRNMSDNHIHFIDGAEGGYTKAAGIVKKKNALTLSSL